MAQGKRGRPRKAKVSAITPELTGAPQAVTAEVVDAPPPRPWHRFDRNTVDRIKECQQVYLVTKNSAQDKEVHPAEWLKDVV